MADLNIKNPSVTEDALALRIDSSGNIISISGHPIAGGGGITEDYTAGIDLKIENNIISVDTNGNPNNTASNTRNFVEGSWTEASGYNSHAEGMATTAYGYAVHAQGMWTKFSSSKWSDTEHPTPIDIYWAAGAGATVEGYCNATTSCPMSGTEGKSDYGPIHGGILKVIGNGNVVHDTSVDPDAHIHTLQPSDALIIFKDGCISAAGNISANGIELGEGGTSYQGRKGVNVVGDYVELTTSAYESVTSVPSISNDVETLKTASGNWNKVSDKLDTTAFSDVSGTFLTAHQSLDDYATKTDINDMATQSWVGEQGFYTKASGDNDYAPKSVTSTINTLTGASAGWNEVTAKLDKSIYSNASGNWENTYNVVRQYSAGGTWLTAHQSLTNYYTKDETSGASELSDEFAKYVTSSNVTTQDTDYVMTTTGWKVLTLPGGGMTQVIHDETLTGQGNADDSKLGVAWSALSGNTIYSAIKANSASAAKRLQESTTGPSIQVGDVTALQDWASSNSSTWNEVSAKLTTAQYATDSATFVTSSSNTITGTKQYALTTAGWSNIGLDDYVPYSATKLAIGSNNDISESNSDNSFAQGTNNKVSTSPNSFVQGEANSAVNYYSLSQGYGNYAQDHALAQGTNNSAISLSLVQGQNNTARSYSIAQGTQNSADTTAFAQGSANKARYDSFAQGNRNSAFSQSLAQGHYNSADDGSLAQGKHNTAYSHSLAQGSMNYADNNAMAQGGDNTAKYFSQALGFGLSIQGSRGTIDGTDYISGGLAIGTYNETSAGVAFVVGNGHSNGSEDPTRSDAFIIYPDGRVSAAGKISANGIELGAGGSFTGVTTAGSISGDGLTNPLGLKTSAEQALTSVSNKVDKPTSLNDKYLVLRTDNAGNVSGWCDFQDQSYSKTEAQRTFVATANIDTTTLSGDGKSVSTKLGVKTDVIATKDYVNSSFLPLSGGTVSGDVTISSSGTCLLAVGTEATLMGQSRVVNMGDTTARGTNWLGVSQSNAGFLKYVNGGNVGALNGTSIQINFAPDGANSYGNITVNSQGNESKVVHVPTASYTKMSTFDSETGPNYMLRKTANGFDIGAAVINTTALPENVQANAYYFIYEM